LEQAIYITPDSRIEYGISNITAEAGDTLIAPGRILAYSAHGVITNEVQSNAPDNPNGHSYNYVARTEVSVDGKPAQVRQVDPGMYKSIVADHSAVKAHQDIQIMDASGNHIKSKSLDINVKGASTIAEGRTASYDKDDKLLGKSIQLCETPHHINGGEIIYCGGIAYDSEGSKIATFKTSDFTADGGLSGVRDHVYYDMNGKFIGTIHGEVTNYPNEQRATIDLTITDKELIFQPPRW